MRTSDIKDVRRLVRAVSRGVKDFEPLCDALKMSPKQVKRLILRANASGFSVDVAGTQVAIRPAEPRGPAEIIRIGVKATKARHSFAIASDIHVGSKYFLGHYFTDYVDSRYDSGVRLFLLPGDLLDGCYSHGRWELDQHGFSDQGNAFFDVLPQRKGLRYVAITGNHDQTFERDSGLVVHRALNEMARFRGRRDFEALGARGAYVRLQAPDERRGLVVELWHPLKGPAYALTYGMQKHVEGYAPGKKPDVLATGHWHQSCYCLVRGVHCLSCGTFQGGGSAFGKALGGDPKIGGWTIEYGLTEDGTVREFRPTWTAYYEHEKAREVAI